MVRIHDLCQCIGSEREVGEAGIMLDVGHSMDIQTFTPAESPTSVTHKTFIIFEYPT